MLQRVLCALLLTAIAGCYQMNLGPKTDVLDNGADGQWKLFAYSVRGQRQADVANSSRALVRVEGAKVDPDSTYPGKVFEVGHSYRIFHFSDLAGHNVFNMKAISYGHGYSKKRKEEIHWFRLDDEYGLRIVLNLEDGKSTRMEMSNVMKSDDYRAELDTARYFYVSY